MELSNNIMGKAVQAVLEAGGEKIEVESLFVDGMYCRSGWLRQGEVAVGFVHKKNMLNILAKGKMLIKTSEEDRGQMIEAPWIGVTEIGSQKLVLALEDCYFMNILRTDETDEETIWNETVETSQEQLENMQKEVRCLEYQ